MRKEEEGLREFYKKIAKIQQTLKAPKSQYNNFGKYKYRNCEDILEAVKPLLDDLVLHITDEPVIVGNRFYIKACATITDGLNSLSVNAYARESTDKKGMDESQITGATSSYARKYALNGLFSIDDTKDADTTNTHDKVEVLGLGAPVTQNYSLKVGKHKGKTLDEVGKDQVSRSYQYWVSVLKDKQEVAKGMLKEDLDAMKLYLGV